MSKYHKKCYKTQNVNEDLVKCFRKNLKNENNFVQTTKELYVPVVPGEENPAYKHYFNTYFIHKWKRRTDDESKYADTEYSKFSMDVDHELFMKLPSKSSSFYWIPDQFSPWKWGGFKENRNQGRNHDALFKDFSKSEKQPGRELQKKHPPTSKKKIESKKPDYKILIN